MPAAIVTGGDSGIGRATAVVLAERGWDVAVTYRSDADGAAEAVAEVEALGRRGAARHLDLIETTTIGDAIDALAEELGGLDCFVNNAGAGAQAPFLEHSLDDWRMVLETNLTGAFVALQAAARIMVAAGRPARIVAVTSVHEHIPLGLSPAYTASKHGLGGLVKLMAYELAAHRITVNAVAPGEIVTPMTQGDEDVGATEVERRWIPAGRPGRAREVAESIAFLASEGAAYVTGASLVVDGGLSLMAAIANQLDGQGG